MSEDVTRALPGELTVGQAARITGIPKDVLKRMCAEGRVPSRRAPSGHFYLKARELPEPEEVWLLVAGEYRQLLVKARAAMIKLKAEVQAIDFDLRDAEEHAPKGDVPFARVAPLGKDLAGMPLTSRDFRQAEVEMSGIAMMLHALHDDLSWGDGIRPR